MSPSVTPAALGLSPAAFARVLRDMALAEGEARRAARAPDGRETLPRWDGAPLDTALAAELEDAAESLDADLEAGGGVELPTPLAERLLAAVGAIQARPTRRGDLAGSLRRSQADAGRAGMLRRAMRQNDLAPAEDWLARVEAQHGPVAGVPRDVALRQAMRVLAEVAEENARRELGEYRSPPDDLAPPLAIAAPIPVVPASEPVVEPVRSVSRAPLASQTIEDCLNHRISQRSLRHHTADQERMTLERFIEIVGDRPVDQYSRADVARFREVMARLPSTVIRRGKRTPFRG